MMGKLDVKGRAFEVPDGKCWDGMFNINTCPLLLKLNDKFRRRSDDLMTCPFRDKWVTVGTARPVKACKEARIK